MKKWLILGVLSGLLAALAPWVAAQPRETVAVSIRPVAMLVKAIAGDELEIEILMPANASPHDYALRFSDVRRLKDAGFAVWVGPELEAGLVKPFESLGQGGLSLSALPGLHWPDGEDDHEEEAGHLEADNHGDSEEHRHSRDPHLWLNPQNALVAATAIERALSEVYPANSLIFESNLRKFSTDLQQFEKWAEERLGAVQGRGFIVTHDGYRHFVNHYGLNQLAAIQLSSGHHKGARHYGDLMAMGGQVACIFTEPQMNSKAALQLAESLGANSGQLDPMGQDTPLAVGSYLRFMDDMVKRFVTCLGVSPRLAEGRS